MIDLDREGQESVLWSSRVIGESLEHSRTLVLGCVVIIQYSYQGVSDLVRIRVAKLVVLGVAAD